MDKENQLLLALMPSSYRKAALEQIASGKKPEDTVMLATLTALKVLQPKLWAIFLEKLAYFTEQSMADRLDEIIGSATDVVTKELAEKAAKSVEVIKSETDPEDCSICENKETCDLRTEMEHYWRTKHPEHPKVDAWIRAAFGKFGDE